MELWSHEHLPLVSGESDGSHDGGESDGSHVGGGESDGSHVGGGESDGWRE